MYKYYTLIPLLISALIIGIILLVGETDSGLLTTISLKAIAIATIVGSIKALCFLDKYKLIDPDLSAKDREELRWREVSSRKQNQAWEKLFAE